MRGDQTQPRTARVTVALVALLLIAGASMAVAACAPGAGVRTTASAGVRGVIASVNTTAFSFVLAPLSGGADVTIVVSPHTEFRGALRQLSDLRTGMTVSVQEGDTRDGTLEAVEIEDDRAGDATEQASVGQQARFDGTVASIGAATSSFQLQLAGGALKTVLISPQTEFEGGLSHFASLTKGQRVSVKGALQADGAIAAASVEADNDAENDGDNDAENDGNEVELSGTITSLDAAHSSFILMATSGGSGTIVVNAQTEFDGGVNGFSDLRTGMTIEVQGAFDADGALLASRVHREDSGSGDDRSNDGSGSGDGGHDGGHDGGDGGSNGGSDLSGGQ